MRPWYGPRHCETVPEQDEVELGAFEGHGHVLPQLWLRPVVPCPGVRARPAIQAEPRVGAERAEPQQMHLGHGGSRPPDRVAALHTGPQWCGRDRHSVPQRYGLTTCDKPAYLVP